MSPHSTNRSSLRYECRSGRSRGRWDQMWKDDMMAECRERVSREYEELDAEKGTVEGEWRQYKDALFGVAEELSYRTWGKEVH